MLVFRDGRQAVAGPERLQELVAGLHALATASDPHTCRRHLLDALLRAGELECALADEGSAAVPRVALLTDALAASLVCNTTPPLSPRYLAYLSELPVPWRLSASTPEGFAYYGLQPASYAAAALADGATDSVAVIGIRSIGTTLSAIVAAALQCRGAHAQRITARPEGHPWDRTLDLTGEQRRWLTEQPPGTRFWIVDEGPGLSGSSFLAVGEALETVGIPRDKVLFLCAFEPNLSRLCARDAGPRWQRFRWKAVQPASAPVVEGEDLSYGQWRSRKYHGEAQWPASWTAYERLKFLAGGRLHKFEGLGRFGAEALSRLRDLGEYVVPARAEADGYASYRWLRARPMSAQDLSPAIVERLAAYCARRAWVCPASAAGDLREMLRVNSSEEFGAELDLELAVERPVFADGRMQPHEWLATPQGPRKTDAATHGDDHFYPGPVDIAWDLAGAAIEWRMNAAATGGLLARYASLTGDDAQKRIAPYFAAYALFRMGYCRMGWEATTGTAEGERLRREYLRYRALAERHVPRKMAA